MDTSSKLYLAPVGFKAANLACQNWHYAGVIPAGKRVMIGVWERGKYKGAIIFSRGHANITRDFNLERDQVCELSRVALREHDAPVTKIIAIALTMLKQRTPSMRLIVSYADTDQGHNGTIYKAGNWLYLGMIKSDPNYFYKGKRIHRRGLSPTGLKKRYGRIERVYKQSECLRVEAGPKHKFIMPLDNQIRQAMMPRVQPYN